MSEQIRKITPDDDKWSVRNTVWDYIEEKDLANFPRPVKNRIPNVLDADKAADRVTSLDVFKAARVVKINPDKPQEQARFNTLEANKTLLVPTPRLRQGLFNKIEPPAGCNKETLRICATSQGIKEYSRPISLDDKVSVDLVIIGSVAVSPKGYRIGKGEGYADLEYAMMRCMDAVTPETVVVTTVHDCQVFDDLPEAWFGEHDVSVDYIVTPTRVLECKPRLPKPRAIFWSMLTREKLKQVPILKVLRKRQEEAGVDVTLRESPHGNHRASGSEDDGAEGDHPSRGGRRGGNRSGGDGPPKQRRQRLATPLPGVFVGRFPPTLRASELKAQVREQSVFPVRMIWRGGKRHAFLLFEKREDAEHALSTLEGMEIDGREVKVEMANERQTREDGEEGEEGGEPRRPAPRRQRPAPAQNNRRRRQESSEGDDQDASPKGTSPRRMRRRRQQRPGPGVYVGSLPRNLKVSEFKGMVRDQQVNPMRVVWRGRNGFSILQFENQEQADQAMDTLEHFSINGRELKIAVATSQPPRGDGDLTEESGDDRPQPARRQRRPRGAPRQPRTSAGESGGEDSPGNRERRERRQRPRRKLAETAVLIGNVPKTVRISEFKQKVRDQDVNPLRVIWRGNNGHAYLQFETDDSAHEAIKLLQGLSIEDNELSVEISSRDRPEQELKGDDAPPPAEQQQDHE